MKFIKKKIYFQGNYSAAFDIISSAKQRFPKHTQHAHVWMICEQQLLFDRAILNRKFGQAETNVTNIRALNEEEAIVRLVCKLKNIKRTNGPLISFYDISDIFSFHFQPISESLKLMPIIVT